MTTVIRGLTADILSFISTELVAEEDAESLHEGSDLLGGGMIDSLGVMRLVEYLEGRCSVVIPPADVTIEHFMTVGRIVEYLGSLGGEDGPRHDA